MSRPSPKVLAEYPGGKYIQQIIECEGVFVVLYNGKPFQLRNKPADLDNTRFDYVRTVYVNGAHARRLANKLNDKFKTDDYTVEQLL